MLGFPGQERDGQEGEGGKTWGGGGGGVDPSFKFELKNKRWERRVRESERQTERE